MAAPAIAAQAILDSLLGDMLELLDADADQDVDEMDVDGEDEEATAEYKSTVLDSLNDKDVEIYLKAKGLTNTLASFEDETGASFDTISLGDDAEKAIEKPSILRKQSRQSKLWEQAKESIQEIINTCSTIVAARGPDKRDVYTQTTQENVESVETARPEKVDKEVVNALCTVDVAIQTDTPAILIPDLKEQATGTELFSADHTAATGIVYKEQATCTDGPVDEAAREPPTSRLGIYVAVNTDKLSEISTRDKAVGTRATPEPSGATQLEQDVSTMSQSELEEGELASKDGAIRRGQRGIPLPEQDSSVSTQPRPPQEVATPPPKSASDMAVQTDAESIANEKEIARSREEAAKLQQENAKRRAEQAAGLAGKLSKALMSEFLSFNDFRNLKQKVLKAAGVSLTNGHDDKDKSDGLGERRSSMQNGYDSGRYFSPIPIALPTYVNRYQPSTSAEKQQLASISNASVSKVATSKPVDPRRARMNQAAQPAAYTYAEVSPISPLGPSSAVSLPAILPESSYMDVDMDNSSPPSPPAQPPPSTSIHHSLPAKPQFSAFDSVPDSRKHKKRPAADDNEAASTTTGTSTDDVPTKTPLEHRSDGSPAQDSMLDNAPVPQSERSDKRPRLDEAAPTSIENGCSVIITPQGSMSPTEASQTLPKQPVPNKPASITFKSSMFTKAAPKLPPRPTPQLSQNKVLSSSRPVPISAKPVLSIDRERAALLMNQAKAKEAARQTRTSPNAEQPVETAPTLPAATSAVISAQSPQDETAPHRQGGPEEHQQTPTQTGSMSDLFGGSSPTSSRFSDTTNSSRKVKEKEAGTNLADPRLYRPLASRLQGSQEARNGVTAQPTETPKTTLDEPSSEMDLDSSQLLALVGRTLADTGGSSRYRGIPLDGQSIASSASTCSSSRRRIPVVEIPRRKLSQQPVTIESATNATPEMKAQAGFAQTPRQSSTPSRSGLSTTAPGGASSSLTKVVAVSSESKVPATSTLHVKTVPSHNLESPDSDEDDDIPIRNLPSAGTPKSGVSHQVATDGLADHPSDTAIRDMIDELMVEERAKAANLPDTVRATETSDDEDDDEGIISQWVTTNSPNSPTSVSQHEAPATNSILGDIAAPPAQGQPISIQPPRPIDPRLERRLAAAREEYASSHAEKPAAVGTEEEPSVAQTEPNESTQAPIVAQVIPEISAGPSATSLPMEGEVGPVSDKEEQEIPSFHFIPPSSQTSAPEEEDELAEDVVIPESPGVLPDESNDEDSDSEEVFNLLLPGQTDPLSKISPKRTRSPSEVRIMSSRSPEPVLLISDNETERLS